MTPTECVTLVALIGARCPAMRLEDATPDAWYLDLHAVPYDDAYEAALVISRRQAFVGLHELLEECHAIDRRRRGTARARELQAQLEAEGVTAIEAAPPAEPGAEWNALGDELRRRAPAAEIASPPKVDLRHDATKLDEARRELAEARQHAEPNKRPDAGNAARETRAPAEPVGGLRG